MTDSLLSQQSQRVATIRSLIAETTATEAELRQHVDQEREAIVRARDAALTELVAASEDQRESAESDAKGQVEVIERRRELEPKLLRQKHEERIEQILEQAEDFHEKTQRKLDEAIWLAESVYEAATKGPTEHFEELRERLDDLVARLDALCEEAPRTLTRLRQEANLAIDKAAPVDEGNMQELVEGAIAALGAIRSDSRARLFIGIRPAFTVVSIAAIACAVTAGMRGWQFDLPTWIATGVALAATIAVLVAIFAAGRNSVRGKLAEFSRCVAGARAQYDATLERADTRRRSEEAQLRATRDDEVAQAEAKYRPRLERVEYLRDKDLKKEKDRFAAVAGRLGIKLDSDSEELAKERSKSLDAIAAGSDTQQAVAKQAHDDALAALAAEQLETTTRLREEWKSGMATMREASGLDRSAAAAAHPGWDASWDSWDPPSEGSDRILLGTLEVDLATIGGAAPSDPDMAIGEPAIEQLPLCLDLPRHASLLVSTSGAQREAGIVLLQSTLLRVLSSLPAGKAHFTLIDPVGLGQTFASVLHLADYEESRLLDRAWTEPRHIEAQLADLTEHMENVIQKYLRNEFESIDDYNEQAGEIAEPYRFLVIADFPVNVSDIAAKRLSSIITSGGRCGVHVLMHHDLATPLPAGIDEDTLARISVRVHEVDGGLRVDDPALGDLPLSLESPPDDATATAIVRSVGEMADRTHRVEVPFKVITPAEDAIWQGSTKDRLAVPLGRAGATKLQSLTLGRGTAQHALIAGKTGSGKSTLLHVLITNLALWYSPREIEFYLVDFKKGVEFKTYATHRLPHAKVVAVESDREFGISVLQRLDGELKRRGELFRELGVQDLAGYRDRGDEPMPRVMLIVDEFQEFFIEDDRHAQEAGLLLDRLVRQGRAFGIHVLLGSQTLDGAYSLARSTMGQMAVRIALQCSEADSYIILSEDNSAARLLSRPGEAIYNDASGRVEGNSPFQVVWLDDGLREEHLKTVLARAEEAGLSNPDMVVYEGNRPVHLAENPAYMRACEQPATEAPAALHLWLGGAMAIKEDTSAVLRRASASNLLIVGQQDETITAMIGSAMQSIAAQAPASEVTISVMDGTAPDAGHATFLREVAEGIDAATLVGSREIPEAMAALGAELERRIGGETGPTRIVILHALQRLRDLRRDEDDYGFGASDDEGPPKPDKVLAKLLREGPSLGMHVIATADTLANLQRSIDRQGMREFDQRVLLQMGSNDSTNLIDAPDASRLGLQRALLYSEETGTIEAFRPYALPDTPGD